VAGLGSSEMSRRYAIGSIEEAQAYLAHPLLGAEFLTRAALPHDRTSLYTLHFEQPITQSVTAASLGVRESCCPRTTAFR
jgi:uncharacterized protein (DUF1810 family)